MSEPTSLTRRQHERHELILDIEFEIREEHAPQVRLSGRHEGTLAPDCMRGTMLDIAVGGVGTHTHIFLPRMTRGLIKIYDPLTIEMNPRDCDAWTLVFEEPVTVRSTRMLSKQPIYSVGMSFDRTGPEMQHKLSDLFTTVSKSMRELSMRRLKAFEQGGRTLA